MKVDRSGLGRHFSYTGIVKEKDSPAYLRLIEENRFPVEHSWMIGNSPKSDINPALEAGLGAVLVPHARTWVLEHQELRAPAGARFLRIERFTDLKNHF
jgi:putative hydrolase of the HAD superfamily